MRKFLFCLALVLVGCDGDGIAFTGNGDGNGDGDGGGGLIIQPTYSYQIRATSAGGPLTVSVPDEGGILGISVGFGNTLNGEVNVDVDSSNNISILDYTLQILSSATVNSDAGEIPFLGAFDVEVTEDMVFGPNQPRPPDQGIYQVVTPSGTVTVQVINGGFSTVEISLDGGVPVSLTWDELENLLDDDLAPAWQRRAALATEVLEFVLTQVFTITDTFNVIDDELLTVNPVAVPCDAFTGTPPPNVLDQGESVLTWLGPGSVPMDGDDFQWAFTDCWFDDPGSGQDALVNGSIELNDYIEIVDDQSQLVGSGFNEVNYNSLEIAGTVESPPGTFTIDPMDIITVNGSFALEFVGITN